MQKDPDMRLQLGVLECSMLGGLWLPNRVTKVRDHIPDECPRCGAVGCDEMHLFWECPLIDHTIDSVAASQGYLPRVRDGGLSCLWLRGILPRACVQVDPQVSVVKFFQVGKVPKVFQSGWFFTDGSGGEYGSHRLLRRCSVGIARMKNDKLEWGLYSALPGPQQSVPRSELFAGLVVLGGRVGRRVCTHCYGLQSVR